MKKLLLGILLSISTISLALAQQKHRTIGARCIYYVPTKGGVTPDAYTGCPVCDEDRAKKYDEEARKVREQMKLREEKIAREVAEARVKEKEELARREERNNIALAELNGIKRQSDDFDRIRQEEATRKRAIAERYNNLVENASREYNEYLSVLQSSGGANIEPTGDAFWDETVTAADFKAVKGKNNLWGFFDKQGNLKIQHQYDHALNFSGGITFVREPKTYNNFLINTKGEIVKRLDKQFIEELKQKSSNIVSFYPPDTISNGIIVLKFSTTDPSGKYAIRYGGLDKRGDLVVPPVYHKVHAFKNGTAQASKFINSEDSSFESSDYYFSAKFTYLEAGLIDKTGRWVEQPKKKMEYSYSSSRKGYLTVTGPEWNNLTSAEKKAIEERNALRRRQAHDADMKKLEAQVNSKVSSATAQGYLVEKIN